jgi:hypothetical protein
MKMVDFWAPCSLVEVYRRFRGAYSHCVDLCGDSEF